MAFPIKFVTHLIAFTRYAGLRRTTAALAVASVEITALYDSYLESLQQQGSMLKRIGRMM